MRTISINHPRLSSGIIIDLVSRSDDCENKNTSRVI